MQLTALFERGVRAHRAGEWGRAVRLYRAALDENPGLGEAVLYLGLALQQLGDNPGAEAAYRQALTLFPGDPDVLNSLGAVLLAQGRPVEAEACHAKVVAGMPDSAEAHDGLGNVALARGRFAEAIERYERSLILRPDSPDTLNNLGVALKHAGRADQAVARLEASLALQPDSADTLCNLGNAWQARGDMARARAAFGRAMEAAPEAVAPRWGACFAELDAAYASSAAIARARERYAESLARLDRFLTLDDPAQVAEAARAVGANQPFYLAYQGGNDRALQARYGALVHRIMTAAYPQFAAPEFAARRGGRIRVGFASGFMHEHSVWKMPTRGWLCHLDRERFKVFGYYTGVKEDGCTAEARDACEGFRHEPHDFGALCRAVLDDRLDVLVYPEIGMDPTCARMAGLRLAPVQCASWGHPMTSGLPSMDYFLSSDLMEPEDGDAAYTETLVRLPNLSVWYDPLRSGDASLDRSDFGLPGEALLYFCPQSLYKYLPQYDALFPRIAARVPGCRFVFLENSTADRLNGRFAARLDRVFREYGVDMAAHVVFLPYQPTDRYQALNGLCDVFLDSIGWSGCNTVVEAANAGLPAVTWPTGQMRGRHTHAVLQRLDLAEAVADSFDGYVDLAVRAGVDASFRERLARKTRENCGRLFGDREAVAGLERFIAGAVG